MSDDEDVGAAEMLLHIGRRESESQELHRRESTNLDSSLVAQDPNHPYFPPAAEDNIQEEAPDFR
jgi:hypothetical protein